MGRPDDERISSLANAPETTSDTTQSDACVHEWSKRSLPSTLEAENQFRPAAAGAAAPIHQPPQAKEVARACWAAHRHGGSDVDRQFWAERFKKEWKPNHSDGRFQAHHLTTTKAPGCSHCSTSTWADEVIAFYDTK